MKYIILFFITSINLYPKGILDRIKELDEKIIEISRKIEKTEIKISEKEKNTEAIELKIKKLEKENKNLKITLKKRIRYLFRIINENISPDSEDILNNERNEKFLKTIINYDFKLIKNYIKLLKKLTKLKENHLKEIENLKKIKKELQLRKEEYKKERISKSDLLKNIKKSKKLRKKLNNEKKYVENKIIKKFKNQKPDKGFKAMKGKLDFPVNAKVYKWYYVKYLKKQKTYDLHKGLTFKIPFGTRVYSIYKGNIVFSSYIKGYGNTIIISHGGGYYSIYMHLSKIIKSRGDRVNTHQLIAFSGDTGATDYPKLYFEIRKNKDPINLNNWFIIKKR